MKEQWRQWINRVTVIGFNIGKYDLNIVKEYFVNKIRCNEDDERNEDFSHVGPVSYEDFSSSIKSTTTRDEYEQFLKLFKENDFTTMGDWLRVYNVSDVVPFIEVLRKKPGQYYPDKIDVCKDEVSISGISMTYVLNLSLEKNKNLELYSPGGICYLCQDRREELQHCSCNGALKCGGYCEKC